MSQEGHVPPSTRPTLGLVTDFLGDSCRGPAWLGFTRATRKLNAHGLTFVGYRPEQNLPHGQFIYDLANSGVAHGLAVNLRACETCRYDEERRFLARFTQGLTLGFGRQVPEFTCLAFDQRSPLTELVAHLVKVHRRHRIAFLAADPAWDHVDGRLETFRSAMHDLNVVVDENLIAVCTQERVAASEVVRRLFANGANRPDAIIACSDRSAYQIIEDLTSLRVRVPEDVSVAGCDDLMTSRFCEPPLTTVVLDEQAMGAEAARILMDWVAGSAPSRETLLPTRLSIRESCGCHSPFGHHLNSVGQPMGSPELSSLDDFQDRLEGRLSVTLRFVSRAGTVSAAEVESLVMAFCTSIQERRPDDFLRELVRLMRADAPGRSLWIWMRILLDMKEEALALAVRFDESRLAPVLLMQGMRMVHDFAWRHDRLVETRQAQNWSARKHQGLPLLRAQNLHGISQAAASVARELDIHRYAVCVELGRDDGMREMRVCLAGVGGTAVEIEPEGRPLPPKTILPDFFVKEGERISALVHPLNVEGLNGYILLDQSTEDWVSYHEYAEHLGSALRGVRALWTVEEQASHLSTVNARLQSEIRERRQAEERLANSVAGLRGILVTANELMQVTQDDAFFRRAVELAREQLGLERCGLWVQMEDSTKIRGTFGTNRQGRTVDESYVVRPKGPAWIELERTVAMGEPHWVKLAGHPHVQIEEARVVEIGHGWVVATPVFGGRKLLGVFFNDTALSGAPLDETRQELVFVYCAMLGSLMLSRDKGGSTGKSSS